ncbi:DoxX family protein [Arenibacter sp. GZD96]|uniref:DoxX family protein n=1 Tax=Aurantibrevibacter litoralis TaxID=3106030 RepID=UPI002AFDDC4F|nr:DoxX family protein [Arenibacter sp. GZD-96]MEA1785242.1 DoxX family protein [Arenibacter sp. GZD-96]
MKTNWLFSSDALKGEASVFALIRIFTGALMFFHGLEIFNNDLMVSYSEWDQFKNKPYGLALVYLGKGIECVTGLGFILGLFVRISALVMAFQKKARYVW